MIALVKIDIASFVYLFVCVFVCERVCVCYRPQPSLLHGDLWRGNVDFLSTSAEPVLFDPACYFGDRECDLAFSEMFGGFPAEFYSAYQAAWPLADGYPVRKRLYNLYHELNHYNLFGGGYAGQARNTVAWLCSQL